MNLPKGSGLEQLNRLLAPGLKKLSTAAKEKGIFNVNLPDNIKLPIKKFKLRKPSAGWIGKKLGSGLSFKFPSKLKFNPLGSLLKNNPLEALMKNNPLDSLRKGLGSMLSQFSRRPQAEDYDKLVMGFLPPDGKVVAPQYPRRSNSYLLADLDGDSREELVTTYRSAGALNTMVLKKQGDRWFKAAVINHPEYNGVNYRGTADMAGDGKAHLLLGLSSKGGNNTLYGYSLADNMAKKLYSRNYDWVELAKIPADRDAIPRHHLAFWKRDENKMYDIELFGWNGTQLEPAHRTSDYYFKRVVPYYMRRVRMDPGCLHGWYSLANAMKSGEAYSDALRISNYGAKLNNEPEIKQRFEALRDEIKELM